MDIQRVWTYCDTDIGLPTSTVTLTLKRINYIEEPTGYNREVGYELYVPSYNLVSQDTAAAVSGI